MKKIIFLAVIALGFAITSCRKERTCECKETTTTVRSGAGAGTFVDNSSTKVTTEKQRKNFFKDHERCFSQTYTYNDEGGGNGLGAWTSVVTVNDDCELK